MSKKILLLLVLSVFSITVFAQATPAKVLTAKDISAFISNYSKMSADLENLEDTFEDFFESQLDDIEDPISVITKMRTLTVPAEIRAVFNKYGMGDKGFEKFMVITMGVSVLVTADAMEEQKKMYGSQPEMGDYMVAVEEMIAQMTKSIHKEDLALIKARLPELLELIEGE